MSAVGLELRVEAAEQRQHEDNNHNHDNDNVDEESKWLHLILKADQDSPSQEAVDMLRKSLLVDGLPDPPRLEDDRQLPTLRGKVWRVMLGVGYIDIDSYLRYVALGPSDRHNNIVEDVQRTHATHSRRSSRFKAVVTAESVIRVMNSFIHSRKSNSNNSSDKSHYSQAWCIYAAILLSQLPEPAAFWCLVSLLSNHSPAFANPDASVARDLSQHFEELLSLFDPELSAYIFAKKTPGIIGLSAYSSIHSLFGHRKPMDQVAKIWDILLAFGAHMVVPLTVAELILKRSSILSGTLDTRKLGTYNPDEEALISGPLVSLAVALLPQVPQDLYLRMATAVKPRTN